LFPRIHEINPAIRNTPLVIIWGEGLNGIESLSQLLAHGADHESCQISRISHPADVMTSKHGYILPFLIVPVLKKDEPWVTGAIN
jgi:hypothetical protein